MNMRYRELSIETLRQAPARARTEGEALLRRAGYIGREGELTPLGKCTEARLDDLLRTRPTREALDLLRLPFLQTAAGEFLFPLEQGGLEAARCPSCGYAALRPVAEIQKAEPVAEPIQSIQKIETPECHTIEALALYLNIPKEKTAKALMYTRSKDGKFIFVVIRGDMQLSEQKLKQLVGDFRPATVEEIVTAGTTPGYASPIGLTEALVIVDDLIPRSPNLVAGANEAGFHLKNTNYERDYVAEIVADLAQAQPGDGCPECGSPLEILWADLLADSNGICVDNLIQALAQAHHDEKGLTLPPAAAPFDVYLMQVPGKALDTRAEAAQLYDEWQAAGISVLFDDRDERAGVKFSDADLIGCPVRATVGERGMKDGMVELKARRSTESLPVAFAEAPGVIRSLIQRAS